MADPVVRSVADLFAPISADEVSIGYCVPPNNFGSLMTELFLDEETADVSFVVGEGEGKRQFFAHKLLLKKCAPQLAALCEESNKSDPLLIADADPELFQEMLGYVYGKSVTAGMWKGHHRDFIDLADMFGVVNLKLEAEARYVVQEKIAVDNVIDNLLYADSKNCALLKETTITFILNNAREVINSDSFASFPSSQDIIKDIFTTAAARIIRCEKSRRQTDNAYESLTVDELRIRLDKEGRDVDGSREVLIARLEKGGK